jgi:hypothetical protein
LQQNIPVQTVHAASLDSKNKNAIKKILTSHLVKTSRLSIEKSSTHMFALKIQK